MSQKKKAIREKFRNDAFKRDKYSCIMCGFKSSLENAIKDLQVHHVCDRSLLPAQGYHMLNAATLCEPCHMKAEQYWSTGEAYPAYPGYSQEDLYAKIGSSYEKALEACKKIQ